MIDYRVKTFLALCDFMNYRKTAQILNMTQLKNDERGNAA